MLLNRNEALDTPVGNIDSNNISDEPHSLSLASREQIKHIIDALSCSSPISSRGSTVQQFIALYPQRAAVLVLLFEQAGLLRVLLTTRAKSLRIHGGQTSLPGGKADPDDSGIIHTAYREANEEVGLPLSSPYVQTLGLLDPLPFYKLLVTPVLALLTNPEQVIPKLKPGAGEVDFIFSHPLEAITNPSLAPSTVQGLVKHGDIYWPYEEPYHTFKDHVIDKLGGMTYRLHCFQTSASPITGFTADVLIRVAEIAYSRPTTYERHAHDQTRNFEDMCACI